MNKFSYEKYVIPFERWLSGFDSRQISFESQAIASSPDDQIASYIVDHVIEVTPKMPEALGCTITFSGSAIGIAAGTFADVSAILSCKVSSESRHFACTGFEPLEECSVSDALQMCAAISNAEFELLAAIRIGRLVGIYSELSLNGRDKSISIGQPRWASVALARFKLTHIRHIPYRRWLS